MLPELDSPEIAFQHSQQMLDLMRGFVVSKTIYLAAELGIADLLASGPRPVEELARESGANADALYRILRALSSIGVFSEESGRQFALTPLANTLRTDAPGSLRNWFLTNGGPIYRAFTEASFSIRTGQAAFARLHGQTFFEFMKQNPLEGRIFDAAMRNFTQQMNRSILASYDFGGSRRVVDVGGGNGALVCGLLRAYPDLSATVLDSPEVVAGTTAEDAAALGARLQFVGGDFFSSIPAGADLYILSWILHDWDDEHAGKILQTCRRAMRADSRLLIVEALVPETPEPHFAKFGDIVMMVLFGGRERTATEFNQLLEQSELKLTRVIPTGAPRSILEAISASQQ